MRNPLLLLLSLLCWACLCQTSMAAPAPEKPLLFENYAFGMPRALVAALPGATEGSGAFAGDLLLPEASFAGTLWNVRFAFKNDELVRVSLMERYSPERMRAVTDALRAGKFEMLALLANDKQLDFVSLLKIAGPEGLQNEIASLLGTTVPPRVIYAWFDTSAFSKEMKLMARNLKELMLVVAAETREAEVTLLSENGAEPHLILVDFSFPLLMQDQQAVR